MASPTNPPIDYTSKDYDGFRQLMIDAIPERVPEWTSRSPSDFGITLIELFSYMGDILSYYGDRIANETFLQTASQRRSLLNIAAMMDYTPTQRTAATTTLQFTVVSGNGVITIPAGTRVSTSSVAAVEADTDPVYFETDVEITIDSDAVTTGTVAASEGRTVTDEAVATSKGLVSQKYPLFNKGVINGSVKVKVNGLEWSHQSNLIDASSTDNVFTTSVDENDVSYIVFGDNINGKIPPLSAAITATYRIGVGVDGNVDAGKVTQFVDTVTFVSGVTNTAAASGGANAETDDQIRSNATSALRTLSRAVTLEDYATLALQVVNVGKAKAEAQVATSINVYIATTGGQAAPQALKDEVADYLSDKVLIGTDVTILDLTFHGVNTNVDIIVDANYGRQATALAVEEAISALLDFGTVEVGETVSLSSMYKAISSVEGVKQADLTLFVRVDDPNQTDKVDNVTMGTFEVPIVGSTNVTATGGIVGS